MSSLGLSKLVTAATRMFWCQVVVHGDSPCFHIEEDGRFCGRALRWAGHQDGKGHPHEPLYVAVTRAATIGKECVWSRPDEDSDLWEGTCGVAWSLPDGTPEENRMNYCPRCGENIAEAVTR